MMIINFTHINYIFFLLSSCLLRYDTVKYLRFIQLLNLNGGKIQEIKFLIFTVLEPAGIILSPQSPIEHAHITEMLWIRVREVPGANLCRVTLIFDAILQANVRLVMDTDYTYKIFTYS
jgi:hypothetical protein